MSGVIWIFTDLPLPAIEKILPQESLVSESGGIRVLCAVSAKWSLPSLASVTIRRLLDRYYLITAREATITESAALEAQFFEWLADRYEDEIDVQNNLDNIRSLLIAAIDSNVGPNPRILDWGCGAGLISQVLTDFPYIHVTGFDVSASMRRVARSKGLQVVDSQQLGDMADGVFDGIVASYVLHLSVPVSYFAEIDRLLKFGGVLVANFHKGGGIAQANRGLNSRGYVSEELKNQDSNKHGRVFRFSKEANSV